MSTTTPTRRLFCRECGDKSNISSIQVPGSKGERYQTHCFYCGRRGPRASTRGEAAAAWLSDQTAIEERDAARADLDEARKELEAHRDRSEWMAKRADIERRGMFNRNYRAKLEAELWRGIYDRCRKITPEAQVEFMQSEGMEFFYDGRPGVQMWGSSKSYCIGIAMDTGFSDYATAVCRLVGYVSDLKRADFWKKLEKLEKIHSKRARER